MWNDNDTPGCFYDTIDCNGQCCEEGRLMFERYLEEKYGDKPEVENNLDNIKIVHTFVPN